MKGPIRLYGHELGYSSFSQVTRGFMVAFMADPTLFGGFVPLDFYDEETLYPGAACPVSINCGMPSGVAMAKTLGSHTERYLMLAPNSDRLPEAMLEWLPKCVTGLLSPSSWGVTVLESLFDGKLPVHLVPHGVQPEYVRSEEARRERMLEFLQDGTFRVLHLTSTNSERKGTKLLLEAWRHIEARAYEPSELVVVCRYEGFQELSSLVSNMGLIRVTVMASDGMPYASMNALYQGSHVLCQPSRAEGFGLCPLEAKAAGVPVVMTMATGHLDHFQLGATTVIETGPGAPSDDMEGATTPSLYPEAILAALVLARDRYTSLEVIAAESASRIGASHSWPSTTGKALRAL